MPRSLPTAIATHIQGATLTLALCVLITRQDGAAFAFTTHDADLTLGGTTYRHGSGVALSALRSKAGAGVDNLEMTGLQTADAVLAADLRAGRYDGAAVTVSLVNWASPSDGAGVLLRGSLGQVSYGDGGFTAEIRSLSQRLSQQVGRLFSPTCRCLALGDAECRVVLANYQSLRTLAAAVTDRQLTFGSDTHPSGYYANGRVVWQTGGNAGTAQEVKAHTLTGGQAALVLQESPPAPPTAGDTALLEKGCDRTTSAVTGCRSFADPDTPAYVGGNIRNYHGEPFLPASDVMIQRVQYTASGQPLRTQWPVTVTAVIDGVTLDVSGDAAGQPDDFFDGGLLFWATGPNTNTAGGAVTSQGIAASRGAGNTGGTTRVVLAAAPVFTPLVGDTATLQAAS